MNIANILTSWTTNAAGANVPAMPPLPAGCGWEDATGQEAAKLAPTPNAVVLRVTATDAYLATLEADPAVTVLDVEEVSDATATI